MVVKFGVLIPSFKKGKNEFSLEQSFENFDCEKLNIKFCKYILGVHKKASNYAVLGELGRYPLYISIICTILKYYNRLLDMDKSSLLYQAFTVNKELFVSGKNSWFQKVSNILNMLEINCDNIDIKQVKNKLISRFKLFWKNKLSNNKKLESYTKYKSNFILEPYLFIIKNRDYRKQLTRLRISAHSLEIEQGRYKNKTREERLCSKCNKIEDEIHFLLHCTNFVEDRQVLMDCVKKLVPNFACLNDENKMFYLMTCEEDVVLNVLAKFIYTSFKNRP